MEMAYNTVAELLVANKDLLGGVYIAGSLLYIIICFCHRRYLAWVGPATAEQQQLYTFLKGLLSHTNGWTKTSETNLTYVFPRGPQEPVAPPQVGRPWEASDMKARPVCARCRALTQGKPPVLIDLNRRTIVVGDESCGSRLTARHANKIFRQARRIIDALVTSDNAGGINRILASVK